LVQTFPDQVIAGLDILNGTLASHGWTEQSDVQLFDFLKQLSDQPLHSIVSTDISKDGTFEGLNLDLYHQMATVTRHSIVASGGVSTINDVKQLRDMNHSNITGCIVGKAIIEGKIAQDDVINFT
jgi:phosphoribosylformimino-5-aminoimidazole carboxamide ribotide isomerase